MTKINPNAYTVTEDGHFSLQSFGFRHDANEDELEDLNVLIERFGPRTDVEFFTDDDPEALIAALLPNSTLGEPDDDEPTYSLELGMADYLSLIAAGYEPKAHPLQSGDEIAAISGESVNMRTLVGLHRDPEEAADLTIVTAPGKDAFLLAYDSPMAIADIAREHVWGSQAGREIAPGICAITLSEEASRRIAKSLGTVIKDRLDGFSRTREEDEGEVTWRFGDPDGGFFAITLKGGTATLEIQCHHCTPEGVLQVLFDDGASFSHEGGETFALTLTDEAVRTLEAMR